jgi:hypothetical protein
VKLDSRSRSAVVQSFASLIASALLLSGLGYALYQQLQPKSLDVGDRLRVAKLDFGVNTVQRKFTKEVLWEGVNRDQVLFLKDAIRTAENSEARVVFDDGTVLDLAENSLVVLDREEDKIRVDFRGGSVFARSGGKGGSAVEIDTGQGKITFGEGGDQGALSLSGSPGDLKVSVEEGKATLQTKDGDVSLDKNQVGKIGKDGKVDKKQLKLILKLPKTGNRIITDGPRVPAKFLWEESSGLKGRARIQISRSRTFESVLVDKRVSQTYRAVLGPGHYFWRVVVKRGDRIVEESSQRSFLIVRHQTPRLEAPTPSERFEYFRETPTVQFKWSTPEGIGSRQKLIFARDRSFTQPVVLSARTQGLRGSRLRWVAQSKPLAAGTYYWKIVSTYDLSEGAEPKVFESGIRTFDIAQSGTLPAPRLREPSNKQTIGMQKNEPVRFEWTPVDEASGYEIEISAQADFEKVIRREQVKPVSFTGSLGVTGRVFWRVRATSGEVKSEPSRARALFLTRKGGFRLAAPKSGQVFEYLKKPAPVEFKWESVGGAAEYLVEVARDRSFKEVLVEEETEQTGYTSTDELKGPLFWRVKAIGSNGKPFALSEVYAFEQKEKQRLAAPEKLSPVPLYRVASNRAPKTKFEWKAMPGAKSYQLLVWRQDEKGKLERVVSRASEKPTLETALQSGTYRWDVLARDAAGRLSQKGEPRQFEIFLSGVLPAPATLSPQIGQLIKSEYPRDIELKWDPIPRAQSYKVTVERVDAGGKVTKVVEEKTNRNSLSVRPMRNGKYRWRVAAEGVAKGSKDGKVKLGEAAGSSFNVKWKELLGRPRQVTIRFEDEGGREPASQEEGR